MATESQSATSLGNVEFQGNEFASLLNKEFAEDRRSAWAIENAVQTLVQQALAHSSTISTDAYRTIEGLIAALDKKLSDQMNLILHHEEFQKLEGTWRGLKHLVDNSDPDEMLKIRVMNISKNDLQDDAPLQRDGMGSESDFKKLYEEEYGQFGGEPYGCLVGDYHFDHSLPDVELLGEMARVAAAAHAPFIAGASPAIMQNEFVAGTANPRDLTKIFSNTEYAAWRGLRDSDDSKYVGLAMPRYLSRMPLRRQDQSGRGVRVRRGHRGWITLSTPGRTLPSQWRRTLTAPSEYGWCTSIRGVESGGIVTDLPGAYLSE